MPSRAIRSSDPLRSSARSEPPWPSGESAIEAFVSSKESGTGLGLALTQQIIGDHGAVIEVTNAAEGGAVFRIKFPHP